MRTLVRNIACLMGIEEKSYPYKKGETLSIVNTIENAFLLIENEKIIDFGPAEKAPLQADKYINANNGYVFPSWCDSHTHIVYAKSREDEFVSRLKGISYEEIAANGGGILNSALKLQQASFEELYDSAAQRLEEVIGMGTGAIEIKSGYGLTAESEMKMLNVIRKLKDNYNVAIKSTFLGAHAIPLEYKENRQAYIDLLINKMIPEVVDNQLADYCDVFCDTGFYTVTETDAILKQAAKYGLKAKIHANELANSGGVQVGIKNNAVSVDHLERIGTKEIELLLANDTIATLLPSTSFFLNIPYAPARKMIDAGLGITLASDYNPGSTPSGNIPFLLSLACLKMNLTPNEAFNAVTLNGAYAMELQDSLGTITKGKIANIVITKPIPSFAYIPYSFGSNHIEKVLIRGKENIKKG